MSQSTKFLNFIGVCILTGLLAGCSSAVKKNETVVANYQPGVPGGTYVEKYQTFVEITGVDPGTREMSFKAADGSTNTYQAGPKFQSFAAYKVGDQIKVTVVRELGAWFAPETPPKVSDVATIAQGEAGTVPGVLHAPTIEVTATVLSVDPKNQTATLQLSDGRVATFTVRKDIDLKKVPVGTTGTIRTSAALAVMRDKP